MTPERLEEIRQLTAKATNEGKWEVRMDERGYPYIGCGILELVERVWGHTPAADEASRAANKAEREANAHLMAAAPELLGYVEELIRDIESGFMQGAYARLKYLQTAERCQLTSPQPERPSPS